MNPFYALSGTYAVVSCVSDIITKEIFEFTSLPHGWFHGGGRPATSAAATVAASILANIRSLGYTRVESFPDPNGPVVLSAFKGDKSLEIRCTDAADITLVAENEDEDDLYYENLGIGASLALLRGNPWHRAQSLLGLYTQDTTVLKKEDTRASHFGISTEPFLLSTWNALQTQAARSANTSLTTIATLPESPQFSGELEVQNSQAMPGLSRSTPQPVINVITTYAA